MSRKRKDEDLEKFEEIVRENKSLRTLNKSLMRQLKKQARDQNLEFDIIDDEEVVPLDPMCPDCLRGKLVTVDLGIKKFDRCELCNWRTKAVKNE